MKPMIRTVVWCLLLLSVTQALAQGVDCPSIVQSALTATDQVCNSTGRNQACYGNLNLQAVPQPGVSDLNFSKPGDLVDVGKVESLNLSPLDPTGQTWGVALMKLQANLPDTLPGQNVMFLLFGNVEIENAVQPATAQPTAAAEPSSAVTLSASVNGIAPFMESLTDTGTTPKMLSNGTKVTIDGRYSMAQMLHVQLADGTGGWVPAAVLTVKGDTSTLPEMNPLEGIAPPPATEAAPQQSPMQAFYFKTGANDAPCAEAPDSGILIQTPEGSGKINLTMNGVDIQLGSTAYVQAAQQASNTYQLDVNIVEGDGLVSSQGVTRDVPAGTRVSVPLKEENNHLTTDGAPGDVEPYDNAALAALPVGHLQRKITVAPALTADAIAALAASLTPVPGPWHYSQQKPVAGAGCPAELVGAMAAMSVTPSGTVTMPEGPFDLQALLATNNAQLPGNPTFSNPEPGRYVMESSEGGGSVRWELHIVSSTHIDIETTVETEGCTLTFSGEMEPGTD
jgi:hypothetical protein